MGFRSLIAAAFVLSLSAPATRAASAEALQESARSFVGALLDGDEEDASRMAGRDVGAWASAVRDGLPGEGPITYFRFLICDMRAKRGIFPVLVRRGQRENIFVVEMSPIGRPVMFDTIAGFNRAQFVRVEAELAAATSGPSAGWTVEEGSGDIRGSYSGLMRAIDDWSTDFHRIFQCFALEAEFRDETAR